MFSSVPSPQPTNTVYALHYPAPPGSQGLDQIKYKVDRGEVKLVDGHVVYHSAIAFPGSSGGAILDAQGRFIAMHCEGNQPAGVIIGWRGVLTSEIASNLQQDDIERPLEQPYSRAPHDLNVLLPRPAVGRQICA